MSDSLRLHGLKHKRLPWPSPSPRACSNSCPLSWWCHPTMLSSVIPFSCLQSFPSSESFPASWLFTSGGQSVGASTSASVQYTHTYFYTLSVRERRRHVTSVAISTTLSQILVSVLVKWNWTLWPLLPTFSACLLSVEKCKPKHKFNQRTEKMQKQRKTIQQD